MNNNKSIFQIINDLGLSVDGWREIMSEDVVGEDALIGSPVDSVDDGNTADDDENDYEDGEHVFVPVEGGYRKYIQDNIDEYGIDEFISDVESNVIEELIDADDHLISEAVENNLIDILGEKTYKDLRRDAPNFLRVRDKSKQTPGSHYITIDENNICYFRTPSHTIPGVTYDQKVKLLQLDQLMQHYSGVKKPADIVRMALEGDIEVHCTDPSWKYWGFQYIGTKKKYANEPEPRYPKVRNPGLKGSVCKHLDNVLFILPFQNGKILQDLRRQKRL